MKKNNLFLLLLSGLIILNSCKNDDSLTPISLELTIRDNLGNAVSEASVKLYASQTDWSNETTQVGVTQFSDESGKVKFNDLSNTVYYWLVEKGCQNNVNGIVTTTSALAENTNMGVVLSSTGTLSFANTSSDSYRVFINQTPELDMDGGTTEFRYNIPTGSYSIRVVQLNGSIDQTYKETLGCGQTLTVTFP